MSENPNDKFREWNQQNMNQQIWLVWVYNNNVVPIIDFLQQRVKMGNHESTYSKTFSELHIL